MQEDWSVIESVTEYNNKWYTGGYDQVVLPDGNHMRYHWADLSDGVVVVAITDSGNVLLVDQYRPTTKSEQTELPAGIVEDGESYCEAGRRELREETGYEAGNAELIQQWDASVGVLRHHLGLVVATDISEAEQELDEDEFIAVREVSADNALDEVRKQPTNDCTILGLLLAEKDGFL